MQSFSWILAGLFLPLFPLSMLFNTIYQRADNVWLRLTLLLIWPLPGIWLLVNSGGGRPDWLLFWALLSAALYAFRAVVIRELGIWSGFMATSAWSLAWFVTGAEAPAVTLLIQVLSFSIPLLLLNLLAAEIERRFDSVYAGIVSGLALTVPRLSGLLVVTVLAVIGSPLFPGFFSMLSNITHTLMNNPLAGLGIGLVWLLWSWSGIRLLQQFLVGQECRSKQADIGRVAGLGYLTLLILLISGSLYLSGDIL